MHEGGWDEILMYPPPELSREKHGMVW